MKIEHISWIWTFHWTPVAPNQLGAAASGGTHFLLGCCPMTAGCVGQLIIATFHIFRLKILCWLSELETPKKQKKTTQAKRKKGTHTSRWLSMGLTCTLALLAWRNEWDVYYKSVVQSFPGFSYHQSEISIAGGYWSSNLHFPWMISVILIRNYSKVIFFLQ